MIAEELHIIRAIADEESNAVSRGLVFKYQQKSNLLKVWGPNALEETKTLQKDLGPEKIKLGAYYIAHSVGNDSMLLDPNDIVTRLERAVTEDGLKRLEKLVLVTCNASPASPQLDGMRNADVSKLWDWDAVGSLIFNLLALLDKKQSRPKTAAWDGYISALPRPAGEDHSIYRQPRKSGPPLTPEQLQQNQGRKIGKGGRLGLIVPDFRKEHKHTFQVVNGKLVVDNYSGWKHFS
jgi:hypothetical protein